MFIIHLGSSGFPSGNAQIQRIRLTFKGLQFAGCNPLIINKHSIHKIENSKKINRYQGIPYIYLSPLISRPDTFLSRNLNKMMGYWNELIFLVKKRNKIDTAIFYDSSFVQLFYYRILSKVLNFKLIIQYVEFRSSIYHRRNFSLRLNDLAFDNYCFKVCDGIIVISEFLRNRAISKNKLLPIIKIPAICDFDEFDCENQVEAENYMMYCGTIVYIEVIEFVINLFVRLQEKNVYNGKLLLVIGGELYDNDFKKLEGKINTCSAKDLITVKKNVPYHNLIQLYKTAELLIVPMRNTFQDIAGFHHKVGEYSATRRPIISTNYGELRYYFKNGFSAILADEYSLESYEKKLTEALSSKEALIQIGEEGFKVGQEKLNYKTYSSVLNQFIIDINKNS